MENNNEQLVNEIIDLGYNVEDVDLSRPVLAAGTYPFTVVGVAAEQSKSNPQNRNLKVTFALAAVAEATNGKLVNPGFRLTMYMPLQDVGKMQPGQWKERPAQLHNGLGLTGAISTGEWTGKTVNCTVKVTPSRTDDASGRTYPEGNEITRFSQVK
jgi:hypothetical protein